MTSEISDRPAPDRQPEPEPEPGVAGPAFAPPAQPDPAPVPAPTYAPPPAGYGAQPVAPVQPPAAYAGQQPPQQEQQPPQELEHHWTPEGLVATPSLPPERVGRGAALALLAIPAGAIVAGIIAELGYFATLSSIVTAALAAVLYARGSGGRVKKGILLIAVTIAVGLAVSFFTSVAVELWKAFPTVDPEVAAGYPSRGSFVTANLFYPPVLAEAAKEARLFIILGVVVGTATIVRLVRTNARA